MTHVKKVSKDCLPGIDSDFCVSTEEALNSDIFDLMLQQIGYELICNSFYPAKESDDKYDYYIKKRIN